MTITLLTIFPDFFKTPLGTSIVGRAQASGSVVINIIDIRTFAQDAHQTTDDRPFGGGPGMVMLIEPINRALMSLPDTGQKRKTILTSAQGTLFTQDVAKSFATLDEIVIVCGHYEGVDQRVADHLVDEEVRIGDYVLTGGESAALVMLDAVVRLLPGVLGNDQSTSDESHGQVGVVGFPQYSRPRIYNGWPVPEVLLSGDHEKVKAWRAEQKKPAEY